ncbi:MAG: DUF1553 domain-containing protein, partial [Pirellulaceae bacterium]|nr:DUF1553 domain-containing protein [Pirellulaceae bacterium]
TVVDQLLHSPHFGEKWTRHWMDLVRYAETYGHEFDYPLPHATEYRDYLIRAFNADVPYDQFIREHIAGDLIEKPRRHPQQKYNEAIIGTGFWYLHEATHAPTDVLTNEADIIDNQLDVFGKAFLGLTVACARCHDHKFDAISTADYYALSAYIQSSCRQLYPLDPGKRIEETVGKLRSLRSDFESNRSTPSEADLAKLNPAVYFAAAKDVIRATIDQPDSGQQTEEVFADFESGYGDWTITGNAFGQHPQRETLKDQQEVNGKIGEAFAGSYSGSDKLIGTLTSPAFTIKRPYINLLVGGGKRGVTVDLVFDDKVIHTATGNQREDLTAKSWDVTAHAGKVATIRLTDDSRGELGHINVDHIVFSDYPSDRQPAFPVPNENAIRDAAENLDLDAQRLRRWIDLLVQAKPNPASDDPAEILSAMIQNNDVAKPLSRHLESRKQVREGYAADNHLFVDFRGDALPAGWTTSGFAFQMVDNGDDVESFVPIANQPRPVADTVDSAVFGRRAAGILRSPTFEIATKNIHFYMRSTANAKIRVIIDNYQMTGANALLFRQTELTGGATDTKGRWVWKSLTGDLRKYVGHRAYLEIVDDSDAAIAIDQIWFSDSSSPPPVTRPWVPELVHGPDGLHQVWKQSLADYRQRKRNDFIDWLIDKDLLAISDLAPGTESVLNRATELAAGLPSPKYVLAMAQGTAENANIYVRGSAAALGDEVPPRNLEALGGETLSRLELADRIASRDNPLTARVIVNRLWHHVFGRGIVPSVDDFGPQGQIPTHPELLDHLATDFMSNGWSIKKALRQMVLSQTYNQASVPSDANDDEFIATADPTNAFLHRMRIRRLPAESIRDAILAVSKRLDPKPFGPSIPTHRNEFMTGRGARGSGPLDGAGRRSVYLSIYRNFLNPFMLAFDMPSPFGPKGDRSNSNVPAQALTLMNDPFVLEQSKHWADRVMASGVDDPRARIAQMVREAHTVSPSDQELDRMVAFLQQHPDLGTNDLQVWTDIAHALLNRKPFYFLR